MKISLLPITNLGKYSVWLSVFFILTGIFFYIFAEVQEVITSDILVTILGSTAVIAQIIAFIFGVIAVVKNKDYSFLVFLAIFVGLVVLGFIFDDIFGLPNI